MTEAETAARKLRADELAMEAGALQLQEGFDAHRPGVVFSRPAAIPADDSILAWHLRAAETSRGAKASREVAADFYRWRESVLGVEGNDAGKVICLLRGASACADVGERALDLVRPVVAFIEQEYGHAIGAELAPSRLPRPLPREGAAVSEFQRLVHRLVRRTRTLPTWLLWFGAVSPPRGFRVRAPEGMLPAAVSTNDKEKDDDRDNRDEFGG